MAIQEKCKILDHRKIGPHYKLILASTYISSHAQPGQFVNIRVSQNYDPLLRRPISFHRIAKDKFELLYEVIGKGTELLAQFSVGDEIDVLGPLGTGFKIDPQKQIHILVGGGMGAAPLLCLAEQITQDSCLPAGTARPKTHTLLGARSKDYVVAEEDFKKNSDQLLVSSDDGSYGQKGLISDLLIEFLENTLSPTLYPLSSIYACGPKAMLKAVAEIAFQKKIDCQVSIEERMACGIGACKGCPVKTKDGYKMVCKEGPVFDAKEIIWS